MVTGQPVPWASRGLFQLLGWWHEGAKRPPPSAGSWAGGHCGGAGQGWAPGPPVATCLAGQALGATVVSAPDARELPGVAWMPQEGGAVPGGRGSATLPRRRAELVGWGCRRRKTAVPGRVLC